MNFVVVAHREKDEFALLHHAHESEARIEVHAALEDILAQSPDAGAAMRVRPPRLLHGGNRLADCLAPGF